MQIMHDTHRHHAQLYMCHPNVPFCALGFFSLIFFLFNIFIFFSSKKIAKQLIRYSTGSSGKLKLGDVMLHYSIKGVNMLLTDGN